MTNLPKNISITDELANVRRLLEKNPEHWITLGLYGYFFEIQKNRTLDLDLSGPEWKEWQIKSELEVPSHIFLTWKVEGEYLIIPGTPIEGTNIVTSALRCKIEHIRRVEVFTPRTTVTEKRWPRR
jgi:hypothetical protein